MLRDRNINFVSKVRKYCKGLPTFKADKDMTRGEHAMFYCKEKKFMAVKWIDNKPVHIVSTIMTSSVSSAKEAKQKNQVECLDLIKLYNKQMGEVDFCDKMKRTYEQDGKGRRYHLRLAFDMMDQLMVNNKQ